VYEQGGNWYIATGAGDGSGVRAYASCIPTANNRQYVSWPGNSVDYPASNKVVHLRNANTYCFLHEVTGTSGWALTTSFVSLQRQQVLLNGVWKDAWTLGGNLLTRQDGSAGGSASAVCVDIPSQQREAFDHQSPSGSSGVWATLDPTAGRACGIHQLVGLFASDPFGLGDGARLLPEDGGSWKVFSSSAKKIAGECIHG
jgi:hypothetical protein